MDLSKFHIIGVVSNPVDYRSRYRLYEVFQDDITRKGAQLWTVELATGARLHKITNVSEPKHIQAWASALPGEIWIKESMINLAIQHISRQHPDWRYIAWVDADVKFEKGMLEKTVHELQIWDLVQMWSHAVDLGPNDETLQVQVSYMYAHWNDMVIPGNTPYTQGGHPGYAWAARREAVNKLGGLVDWAVLGSADRHMAGALVGKVHETYHHGINNNYKEWLHVWQSRAETHIRRNVGYVQGTIRHLWHGKKSQRGYSSRWKLLVDHQFNPVTDIKKDVYGLWQLVAESPRQIRMRDDMRRYFRDRMEDSTDLK